MATLNNTDLAAAISDSDCNDCEKINTETQGGLPAGEGIFVVPIGVGGSGLNGGERRDVFLTLIEITEEDAATVNGLITTNYEIVSQNGYPN